MCIACKDYNKDKINRKEWAHNWSELNGESLSSEESSSQDFRDAIEKYVKDSEVGE